MTCEKRKNQAPTTLELGMKIAQPTSTSFMYLAWCKKTMVPSTIYRSCFDCTRPALEGENPYKDLVLNRIILGDFKDYGKI